MPRTIVTGAAGFTGSYVIAELKAWGHEVIGAVRSDMGDRPGCDTLIEVDLLDVDQVNTAIAKYRPDHVVHLAAVAYVDHADIMAMYATNIAGTRNLLFALRNSGYALKSVILASSANIYGNAGGVIDESVAPQPANDYGVSKVAMEAVASIYRKDLPLIITRPFNYTGVGQSASFLIPKIIAAATEKQPKLVLGNLDVSRDFSDVRSVATHYRRLLNEPRAIGVTLNVSSGTTTSLRDLVKLIEERADHQFEIVFDPALARSGEVISLQGNSARLAALIGPLREIPLLETVDWMLGKAASA